VRGRTGDQQRVAVRRSARDVRGPDRGRAARLVENDDLLAKGVN
jgi:hypothetical protein